MELIYRIKDKPPFSKMILAAFQQLLAIFAACALFLGVVINLVVNIKKPKNDKNENS